MRGLTGLGIAAVLTVAMPAFAQSEGADLQPLSAFEGIKDETARSAALFEEMSKVLTHPRCLNCHPAGDTPLQGDAMEAHQPPVVRFDAGGMGAPGMRCSTCHNAENVAYVGAEGSIPGHEIWVLAPRSMAWVGKSVAEICEQIKDPERNGNRSLADLHEHHAEDGLVGWAWHPGEGRTPAPGSQEAFGALTQAWIDTGAHCPS